MFGMLGVLNAFLTYDELFRCTPIVNREDLQILS